MVLMSAQGQLSDLLQALFVRAELECVLEGIEHGLATSLPGETASAKHVAQEAAGLLMRTGYVFQTCLWEALRQARPLQRRRIDAVACL
ncbi:hypothetical protein [Nannocystis pusilla]|uniref:hypothetical protein n=1 Tax=Nannocystis pusilla TaxID=889268 RepID=UPI003BF5F7C8